MCALIGSMASRVTAHADPYSLCWPCMTLMVRGVSFTVLQATYQQLNVGLLKEKVLHHMLLW